MLNSKNRIIELLKTLKRIEKNDKSRFFAVNNYNNFLADLKSGNILKTLVSKGEVFLTEEKDNGVLVETQFKLNTFSKNGYFSIEERKIMTHPLRKKITRNLLAEKVNNTYKFTFYCKDLSGCTHEFEIDTKNQTLSEVSTIPKQNSVSSEDKNRQFISKLLNGKQD